MKNLIKYMLLFFILGCGANNKENRFDPLLLQDKEGRLSYDLRCINFCQSDSQESVLHIYDMKHKLSYIQEIKGNSLINSIAMAYCGSDEDKRWLAGHYIFEEYFNNNLLSPSIAPIRTLSELDSAGVLNSRFISFIDSTMQNNFAIRLDTCEMENLFKYVIITRKNGKQ